MTQDGMKASNSVEGDISGQVIQVGVVHGDLAVHAKPPRPESAVWISVELAHSFEEYRYHGLSRWPTKEVYLFVEAFTAQAVILNRLRPVITRRILDYSEHDSEGFPDPLPMREFTAELDLPEPVLYDAGLDTQELYADRHCATRKNSFPYYVTASSPEYFAIRPIRDKKYSPTDTLEVGLVEWHLELDWSCLGQRGTAVIDEEGSPFLCRPLTPWPQSAPPGAV